MIVVRLISFHSKYVREIVVDEIHITKKAGELGICTTWELTVCSEISCSVIVQRKGSCIKRYARILSQYGKHDGGNGLVIQGHARKERPFFKVIYQ